VTTTLDLDGLQELLWGFASHRVITVAARAGVLSSLAEHETTVEELATELGLAPHPLGKVVRALTALGIVEPVGDRYRMVDTLAPHFRRGPEEVTPFLEHSHDLYDRWGENLEPWLRGQEWTVRRRDPAGMRRFGAAMRAMGSELARRLAAELELDGVERMLDVGGGFGHYALALCRARPGLRATVLDTPEVVELATAEGAAAECADRIEFVGGDYHTSDFGQGYDLVLIASVLHQEAADGAAALVCRSAVALAPGGRLVVLDFSIDDARQGSLMGALFAINMRSFGDTHTEPAIRGWMEAAGLERVERRPFGRFRWLIIGHRPAART